MILGNLTGFAVFLFVLGEALCSGEEHPGGNAPACFLNSCRYTVAVEQVLHKQKDISSVPHHSIDNLSSFGHNTSRYDELLISLLSLSLFLNVFLL